MIPEDRSSISTFEVLADQQQVILKGVLEEEINSFDSKATIKAKNFYKSCIDLRKFQLENYIAIEIIKIPKIQRKFELLEISLSEMYWIHWEDGQWL